MNGLWIAISNTLSSLSPRNEPPDGGETPDVSQKRSKSSRRHRAFKKVVPHLNLTASRWALLPVLLVVWLAPFLGGSVDPWAKGTLFLAVAVLLAVYPVGHEMKMPYRIFLVILVVLPLLAFLPLALTGVPTWRNELTRDFAVTFPRTISPQPWLTADAWLAWLGGVVWIYWLAAQGWTREVRKPLAELFAIGMIVLTAVGLIGYHTKHPLPIWHAERLFGPFPNRNQTADLLSLTFVLLVGLLHMTILKKSRFFAVWAVGLAIVGYGLIVNYSRAGIILPVVGVAFYWLLATLTTPSRKKIWIGLASLILATGLLLTFGGETLDRFTSGANTNEPLTNDFRLLIFRDTLAMTSQHAWFGVGLGNFQYVFPIFRKLAVISSGIIHPESDWLWLASEIGWPGTVLILGTSAVLVFLAIRAAFKRPHPLRLASAVCGALFVFHGFFDVSGHRFGTFFPACFLFALAWPNQLTEKVITPWRSRAIAAGLVIIAVAWWINSNGTPRWPGQVALATIQKNVERQIVLGHGEETVAQTNAALAWAPLDWQLYYQRGTGRILERRDWAASLLDFQLTNHLNRYSPIPPNNQGIAWLSYRPELAAIPWAEALRRMPAEERQGRYASYLELAAPYPRLRIQMEALGANSIAQSIIQLNVVEESRFPELLAEFLKKHPHPEKFSAADQRAFLDVWAGRGDPLDVVQEVRKTPSLLPAGTVPLAFAQARLKRYQLACEMLFQKLKTPLLPKIASKGSESEIRKEFYAHNNLSVGVALYHMQIQRKDTAGALTTLERLGQLPDAPIYLRYFAAQIHAGAGNWERAWAELADYVQKSRL